MFRTIHIFIDASFDKTHQLGVSGYLLLENSAQKVDELTEVVLQSFSEQNNIRAELRGAIGALQVVTEKVQKETRVNPNIHFDISLYTDCETIAGLPKRRQRLETNQFRSKKSGELLHNGDLYQEFFHAYAPIQPPIHWIKGHAAKNKRGGMEDQFKRVDVAVRKKLRALLAGPM